MTIEEHRRGRAGVPARSAAASLQALAAPFLGGRAPFRIRAWDGSVAGPPDAPLVVVGSPGALRRLLWSPGELGLARAFVSGDLEVEGDLVTVLAAAWSELSAGRRRGAPAASRLAGVPHAVRAARTLGLIGRRPAAPQSEVRVAGRRHSVRRDRSVVEQHYDLSNDFYALVLDKTMAYSCAYWTSEDPGYGLYEAQLDKLELVCAKLGLDDRSTLLDVGCGWGSLTLHAAARHGAHVTAVTLSHHQASHVRARVDELGLGTLVDVVHGDYRSIAPGEFDAVTSIEMGEHVGRHNYPAFAARLAGHLRPGGRLLVQQMSRPADSPGGGPFVETYIAPDMHMRPVGETVAILESAGLEVRDVEALREHYARTVRAWYERLGERHDDAVALVGDEVVRVWRLYLAGIALGFERGRTGVDQILAVRPNPSGASGMQPTRDAWAVLRTDRRRERLG